MSDIVFLLLLLFIYLFLFLKASLRDAWLVFVWCLVGSPI